MTLKTYDAAKLDRLSLRLVDVVAQVRRLAEMSRENGLETIDLHDRKPLEWMAHLETWARKSALRLERKLGPRPSRATRRK